jgi:hypothetical protein
MKIYLAGPMSGLPEFNFPAFDVAAAALRNKGHEVFSPAERDRKEFGEDFAKGSDGSHESVNIGDVDIRNIIKKDLDWICDHAEAIALLPGWEASKGARVEWALAQFLNLKNIYISEKEEAENVHKTKRDSKESVDGNGAVRSKEARGTEGQKEGARD